MSKLREELEEIVGVENASESEVVRGQHSADQSSHRAVLPDAVVWPDSTDQVQEVVRYAARRHIAVVPWGAGTSLEGNPIPLRGGIVIDFQRMNRILAVHVEDFQVTVQPGVLYKDMNKTLSTHGLFFAPDPGANASIGGMIANNAAGTRTPKYGATRDNVLALEVVLADGSAIRTGSRTVKQSAGYDLTHLFTGSEGTLGLITEATLRLVPIPEHFCAALAAFDTVAQAADAVFGIIGSGIRPAAIELMDTAAIRYINSDPGIELPEKPHLIMEYDGASEATLQTELDLVEEICRSAGNASFTAGVGRAERDRLWEGRHHLFEAMLRQHPGETYLITDVCVPISAYPEIATFASDLMAELGLRGAVFGHAGDGNLHTIVFSGEEDSSKSAQLQDFNRRVILHALALEGTCSGEHGVGIGKQSFLPWEVGARTYAFMGRLKRFFDPDDILNPGKIVDS